MLQGSQHQLFFQRWVLAAGTHEQLAGFRDWARGSLQRARLSAPAWSHWLASLTEAPLLACLIANCSQHTHPRDARMADTTPSSFRLDPSPTYILMQTIPQTPFSMSMTLPREAEVTHQWGGAMEHSSPPSSLPGRGLSAGVSSAVLCLLGIFSRVCFPNTTVKTHTHTLQALRQKLRLSGMFLDRSTDFVFMHGCGDYMLAVVYTCVCTALSVCMCMS